MKTFTSAWDVVHPAPSLQYALPADVAGAHGAVVLGTRGDALVVAVPDPRQPGLGPALEALVRRPVELVAAGRSELTLALALATQSGDPEEERRKRLMRLVLELGLQRLFAPELWTRLEDADREHSGQLTSILQALPEGWGLELLGLLEGLPHASVTADLLITPFWQLIPPSLRNAAQVVPLAARNDTVYLGCARMPEEDVLLQVSRWCGLRVQCILIDAAALALSLQPSAAKGSETGGNGFIGGVSAVRRAAGTVASRNRTSALQRQIAPHTRPASTVRRTRSLPEPDAAAVAILPVTLSRSLAILPLSISGEFLEVAVSAEVEDRAQLQALLVALTGYHVRLRSVDPQALRAAQVRVGRHDGAGRVHGAVQVHEHGGHGLARGLDVLLRELDVAERLGIEAGLPSVRLAQYALRRDAVAALPLSRMEALGVIPLRREDEVLWVAMASPDGALLQTLERETGLYIRSVIADPDDIAERLAVMEESHDPESMHVWSHHPVLERLQSDRHVTRTEFMGLLIGEEGHLDVALDRAGLLDYVQFARVVHEISGFPLTDLHLQSREEEVFDALGRRTVVRHWHDPVQPNVVSLLDPDDIRRAGVLPVRAEDGELVVAVADPYDPETQGVLSMLDSEVLALTIAPRPEILGALSRAQGHVPLGDSLVANGILSRPELERGLKLQRTTGIRLGAALLTLGLLSEEQLAFYLAEQRHLPFYRLVDIDIDPDAAHIMPEEVERRLGLLPLYCVGDTVVMATTDPLDDAAIAEAEARTGLQASLVVCTESDLESAFEELYRSDYLERSTSELVVRSPDDSASIVVNRNERIVLWTAAVVIVGALVRFPIMTSSILIAICTAFYLSFSLYKSYLIYRALSHELEIPVSQEEVEALDDATLPVYTILVPLYKEASVLPTLLLGMTKLDYPAAKLDVKILLEEDDIETREAVDRMALPSYVQPVVVPAAPPRNKPKACNYGLIHARGTYVVIFDAEDVPDPDQLKKVVVAFQKAGPEMSCIQAKLHYYNSEQNLLTRWFTIEYLTWFDLFLPGLDASGAPVPLGGTSNHFPANRLREVGAWDPYNVTEDADLGVRLHRHGWKTAIVDSITYEEANSQVYNWIRQRSRWVKGYVQTYLVHMRHPIGLYRSLGFRAFFGYQMVIGGTFFSLLINPIFWLLTAIWYLSHAAFIRDLYPAPVFYMSSSCLVIGNFAFTYLNMAGCVRRGHYNLAKYALLVPLYWGIMSIAAWKGFLQLFTKPFYWEKTVHGLYKAPAAGSPPE